MGNEEKHIIKEGSRTHVISYSNKGMKCSEPNCEINFEENIMGNEELKLCPFCGWEAVKHNGSIKDSCLCPNERCILFARIFSIQDWNTRPEPKKVEGDLVEELERIIEDSNLSLRSRYTLGQIKKEDIGRLAQAITDYIKERG